MGMLQRPQCLRQAAARQKGQHRGSGRGPGRLLVVDVLQLASTTSHLLPTQNGITVLHDACGSGQEACAKLMLENKANIEAADKVVVACFLL